MPRVWVPRVVFVLQMAVALSLPFSSLAQQAEQQKDQQTPQSQEAAASTSGTTAPSQQAQNGPGGSTSVHQGQQAAVTPKDDRLFGVLPNNLTVENEAQVPALGSKGKFKLVAKNSFDPVIFPFIGFIALVGQVQNSEPEFGQGPVGYGRRYGTAFGDSTIGSFMTGAIFPSLFRQDPRYYQLVHGGLKRRALYAVSRIVITRTDSGRDQFNSSEILGNFVAAGISNAYHPAQDRSFTNTVSIWGTGTGWDTVANLAEEFWPDIHVWLKQKFSPDERP